MAAQLDNIFSYFGLTKNPFIDSIDPCFFFQTKRHEEAFIKMLLCIENDISLGLVYAKSGLGKTMLSQLLLLNMDQNKYKPVLVLSIPKMSRSYMLREICLDLDIIKEDERFYPSELLRKLQQYIMELYEKKQKLVIIFDEAHFFTPECLHTIRTISNIEIPEKKLTTCILIGETSLWSRLQRDTYDAIRSRIYQKVEILPLTPDEVEEYIKFRLLISGGSVDIFDKDMYSKIADESKGICREINKICYNLLLEAYFKKEKNDKIGSGLMAHG